MSENTVDFKDVVRNIERKKILLPDFQREFVWRDEEQQKKIVASILAKMPIGSILLLKSKASEYSSKLIGCKNELKIENEEDVEFLLDGQQRITVLTNVFSNIIHEECTRVSDLVSPSLKRRFFLKIPKWVRCREVQDWFGVHNLEFQYQNPDSEVPNFLTADIYPFVECLTFLNNDDSPYNPQQKLSTKLDDFCLTYSDGYLIPLFLLAPSENHSKAQTVLRYDTIVKGISEKIGDEIINHFVGLVNNEEKDKFIDEIFDTLDKQRLVKQDYEEFSKEIKEKENVWAIYLKNYLESCIKSVALNKIVVSEKQRARAIDIYENLNRGGISLNTFDLIMARVAKVSNDNFYKRIIGYMTKAKEYSIDILPDKIANIIGNDIKNKKYNATISTKCYNEEKNEINSKYIDVFLDVLSLYCNNKEFNPEDFKLDYIKKPQILSLAPEEIHKHSELICEAIDKALFFFQTRCGIRNIQEINYSLILVLVATIFVNDVWFNDKTIHDMLEAWYWGSVFSGEYDKDQNVTMISNLQLMVKTLKKQQGTAWIGKLKEYVLNAQNFSDKSFLLMERVDEERYPKRVLVGFMCQYLLAKTYIDMFDSSKCVSVFYEKANDLEAHHIIPLGTVKKVGESSTALRNNPKHICNSPLNFVYITKTANKAISDDSLNEYINKICAEAKTGLHITNYTMSLDIQDSDSIKRLLEDRFTFLMGDIKTHISSLLI